MRPEAMRLFGVVTGLAATVGCMWAGFWLLNETNWGRDESDSFVWAALGLYFVGKGFFVGPMLYLTAVATAERVSTPPSAREPEPSREFQIPARALPPNR